MILNWFSISWLTRNKRNKYKFYYSNEGKIFDKNYSVTICYYINHLNYKLVYKFFFKRVFVRMWVSVGNFIFSERVLTLSYWWSLKNLSVRNRKSMGKLFERFSLALKLRPISARLSLRNLSLRNLNGCKLNVFQLHF